MGYFIFFSGISGLVDHAGRHKSRLKFSSEIENFKRTPPFCQDFQARKESTKMNFLGLETARWGGGLPREGVVAEKFAPSLESLSSLGFEERLLGCPGNFSGMSRTPGGVQKVCAKKVRAHFSFPRFGPLGIVVKGN